jgi:hypothetical protein
MKTLSGRQYSFKEVTQFSSGNKVGHFLASNTYSALTRDAVLVPFTWKRRFAKSWCSSPMKSMRGRQYFIKQLTHFPLLNKVRDRLASIIKCSITRDTVLLPFILRGLFCTKVISPTMRTLRGRQYSFKQLTQFTMLKKVLGCLASNINDSLTRATVLLPFTWIWWFCKRSPHHISSYFHRFPHLWKRWEVGSIPLNIYLNSKC